MEEGVPPEVSAAASTSPAPRVEALFAATLKEGWLRENVCTGMLKGMVESVRSGKRTEDECLELSKKKLAGMRKGGEAKRKSKGGAAPAEPSSRDRHDRGGNSAWGDPPTVLHIT